MDRGWVLKGWKIFGESLQDKVSFRVLVSDLVLGACEFVGSIEKLITSKTSQALIPLQLNRGSTPKP